MQIFSESISKILQIFINLEKCLSQLQILNNLILALTSFGLFEITWEYFDDDSDENLLKLYPYGKVKFFKMTDLGKFAFGLTDSFVFAQKNNISPIKLSSEFLAIECPSENKVASAYLFKTSTKIIGNTFFFEKKDILSNFNSQNAVQNFFKTLERYSSQDLPENWEKLKSECLSSSISIKIEDDWKILTLPSNPEVLQTFVSYQSVLKDKCLKVEGFKVAIKKDYVRNFLILLERAGFIIEE